MTWITQSSDDLEFCEEMFVESFSSFGKKASDTTGEAIIEQQHKCFPFEFKGPVSKSNIPESEILSVVNKLKVYITEPNRSTTHFLHLRLSVIDG